MAVVSSGEASRKQLHYREGRGPPPAEDRQAGSSPLNVDCLIIQASRSPWLFKHGSVSSSTAFIILTSHLKTRRLKISSNSPNSKTQTVARKFAVQEGHIFFYFNSLLPLLCLPRMTLSSSFLLFFCQCHEIIRQNVRLGRKL